MNEMTGNKGIGQIIQTAALTMGCLDILGCLILWIGYDTNVSGLVWLVVALSCVLFCIALYAFGQLVEDIHALRMRYAPQANGEKEEALPEL